MRGDSITIKAHVEADGKKELSLDYISAAGFFGNLALLDDGKHNDVQWKDGFFAGDFNVSTVQSAGFFYITVSAKQNKAYFLKKILVQVKPELEAGLATEKASYYLGDKISFSGSLKRHGIPVQKNFELLVFDAAGKVAKIPVETNAEGEFSGTLHSSLIDAPGTWNAGFSAMDDLNNTGTKQISFEVKKPEQKSFLQVQLIEQPSLFYRRGSELFLMARVFDDSGNEMPDANIELETPLGEKIQFEKSDENISFVAATIPFSMPAGKQGFTIHAEALSSEGLKSGDLNVSLNIKETEMRVEFLSPTASQAMVGETLDFAARIFYENGTPLNAKSIEAKANNETITLFLENGVYSGQYVVKPSDSAVVFAINADDGFGNKANFSTQISVEGISVFYYLREYYYLILACIVIALIAAWIARGKIKTGSEIALLKKQRGKINALLEKTEQEYIDGKIPRSEYNGTLTRNNAELLKINSREKELESRTGKKEKKKAL